VNPDCFTNRIVNMWNSLPDNVILADNVNQFKNRLDKHWKMHDIVLNYCGNFAETKGLAYLIRIVLQEAQLSLTNRAMLVRKDVEVCMQEFLSEYVDKKFTYICYRRLIRHE